MSRKRFVSCMVCLSVGLTLGLGLGWAATAQASNRFHLVGGGGQIAIGGVGLPLQAFTGNVTGTHFPPLLVPARTSRLLRGTTEMAQQKRLCIPQSLLSKPATQRTLGMYAGDDRLFAVATNLGWHWPAATAHLSTGARTGNTTTTFYPPGGAGASIRYSNAKGRKFGGPARFSISHGQQPQGRIANSPVTLYATVFKLPFTGCTHPVFGGTDTTCIAALGGMWPPTQWVIGGPVSVTGMTTPLGNPKPGIGFGKFGTDPPGTVSLFAWTGGNASGFTNQGTSYGYPWTTGMLTIKMTGAGETFTITGMDNRTPGGSGTIQLVAGSLSTRAFSGPTSNRGWVRLVLERLPDEVPTMSPAGFAAYAGLMLLAVGYALRRRFPR